MSKEYKTIQLSKEEIAVIKEAVNLCMYRDDIREDFTDEEIWSLQLLIVIFDKLGENENERD